MALNASAIDNDGASGLFSALTGKKNKTKVVKAITKSISSEYKWVRPAKKLWLS